MFISPKDRHIIETTLGMPDEFWCHFCGKFTYKEPVEHLLFDTIKRGWVHHGCYEISRKDGKL